jgi:hypothetical protein
MVINYLGATDGSKLERKPGGCGPARVALADLGVRVLETGAEMTLLDRLGIDAIPGGAVFSGSARRVLFTAVTQEPVRVLERAALAGLRGSGKARGRAYPLG